MRPYLLVAALLVVSTSAFALIGEDAKQVAMRYGPAKQILADRANYRKLGYDYGKFMVVVTFIDGASKQEGFALGDKSLLSPDAIKQILSISTPPLLTWRDLPPKDGDRFWERSDGKANAILPAQGNFFIVQYPNFVEPE